MSRRRKRYIDALEVADRGPLRPLVNMFVRTQRQAFIELLQVRDEVVPPENFSNAVRRLRQIATQKHALGEVQRRHVTATVGKLSSMASERLARAGYEVEKALREVIRLRSFRTETPGVSATLKLTVNGQQRFSVTITFAQLGRMFHGLMVATMEVNNDTTPVPVGDPFQINHREFFDQARTRFEEWLEKNLARAISMWRL